jgi:hypothetical protein
MGRSWSIGLVVCFEDLSKLKRVAAACLLVLIGCQCLSQRHQSCILLDALADSVYATLAARIQIRLLQQGLVRLSVRLCDAYGSMCQPATVSCRCKLAQLEAVTWWLTNGVKLEVAATVTGP